MLKDQPDQRDQASVADEGALDELGRAQAGCGILAGGGLVEELLRVSPGNFQWTWYEPRIGFTLRPETEYTVWNDTFVTNELGYRAGAVAKEPGVYRAFWNGKDFRGKPVASGVFFYSLEWNGEREVKRMMLVR